jgi:hypothetical protein
MRRTIPQPASVAAAVVVLASLAVRVHLALRCAALPEYSDMEFYNEVALSPGFPTALPAGYPLFLRAVYALFGARNYTAVFVGQSVLSALTVYLVYRVARKVGTAATGITAAAVAAVYPNFILYNLTTLTETWSLLVLAALLAVLVAAIGEARRSILAALLLVIGFLFKPVMLFLLPGTWLAVRRKAFFAAAAAVVFVPLVSYEMIAGESFLRGSRGLYKAYHDPAPGGSAPMDSMRAELDGGELPSASYLRQGWVYIRDQRAHALESIHRKSTILVSRGWDAFVLQPIAGGAKRTRLLMDYAYLPVMVLGFIGMARRYGPRNRMIALPAIGYVLLVLIFSIFKYRYRLLLEPVLIIYAALLLFPPKRERAAHPQS